MQNDKTSNNQADDKNRKAAADIIRNDIDLLFDDGKGPQAQAEAEIRAQEEKPAITRQDVDHTPPSQEELASHQAVAEQWKNYHTSWSSYYQQYYERYYLNHLHNATQNIQEKDDTQSGPSANIDVIGSLETETPSEEDKAVDQLREQLLTTVKERTEQVKKSRHYVPILTAVMLSLVFLFLQYNQFLFATVHAYISPGSIDPQNIFLDPSSTKVGKEPKLIIPKINVEAPAVYGVNPLDNNAVENQLREGVVHYPIANAASLPGQTGATTFLGHSSMDVFDDGKYKFVFVQLSKLNVGDSFYINYQGTRYTYSVTKKEVISPSEIAKVTPTDPTKPSAILITCDPPGTALKRLLVFGDQISPDPSKATKGSSSQKTTSNQTIRGDAPSALEKLFGIR